MYYSVARSGDSVYTGHPCDTSTTILSGSPNVKINGIPVAREDDPLAAHTFPQGSPPVCVPHIGQKVNSGSPKVLVNGKRIARVLDSADLGYITKGSQNVFST